MDAQKIKNLREMTGASILDCKTVLVENDGDIDKAAKILKEKGLAKALKKSANETPDGLITSYIHGGGRIGVLLHLGCQTDFVAKNEDFVNLAKEIALHIASMNPQFISKEKITEEELNTMKVDDQSEKEFYKETVLLEQPYVREPSKTVNDLIQETIAKVGENIVVVNFSRFEK
jgi:elongation factor Ts